MQDAADKIVLQVPSLQALIAQLNEAGKCWGGDRLESSSNDSSADSSAAAGLEVGRAWAAHVHDSHSPDCLPLALTSQFLCCRRLAKEGGRALPGVGRLLAAAGDPERHRLQRRRRLRRRRLQWRRQLQWWRRRLQGRRRRRCQWRRPLSLPGLCRQQAQPAPVAAAPATAPAMVGLQAAQPPGTVQYYPCHHFPHVFSVLHPSSSPQLVL